MAYVAISNNLLNSTMDNIDKMRDKETAAISEVPSDISLDPEDHLALEMSWGVHKSLRSVIPEDWTQAVRTINVRITVPDEIPWSTDFYIRAKHDQFRVPNLRSNNYDSITTSIDANHSFALTVAARHLANQRQYREINAKWKKIKAEVKAFLNASKSLNEALKLWPALALYISDSYIDKINNNAKREVSVSRAAEILANINTDDLTAAAVSVKLT
jgi:hypothetical protein